jgi:hypothetical protein
MRSGNPSSSSHGSQVVATSVASAAIVAAVVMIATAFAIRRRRLSEGYAEKRVPRPGDSPRDPLLSTSVLNYTDDN